MGKRPLMTTNALIMMSGQMCPFHEDTGAVDWNFEFRQGLAVPNRSLHSLLGGAIGSLGESSTQLSRRSPTLPTLARTSGSKTYRSYVFIIMVNICFIQPGEAM